MDGVDRQFEILMKEIELVSQAYDQLEQWRKETKNWGIAIWTAAIAAALATENLTPYAPLTVLFPLAFWSLEGRQAWLQQGWVRRRKEITKYINSSEFLDAIKEQSLQFALLTLRVGRRDEEDQSWFRCCWRLAVAIPYPVLVLASLFTMFAAGGAVEPLHTLFCPP
jgi:hypothetical protein